MKKLPQIIFISFLLLLNFFLLYKYKNLQSSSTTNNCFEILNKVNSLKSLVIGKDFYHYKLEGTSLENIYLKLPNSDSISLQERVNAGPILVFRYSELHCQVCVDSVITDLKKEFEEIGENNIIILSSYRSKSDLLLFKRMNQLDLPVYNINEESLSISIDQAKTPYMFVLDSNLTVNMIFIPEKTLPELNTQYFKFVKQRYFNNERS